MVAKIEDILIKIQACTNLLELNELWDKYHEIPELNKAMQDKCGEILSHLDD